FVDGFSSDGHIGDDIHPVTADFHKSLSDCQKLIAAVFAHHKLSGHHLGHHSDVLWQKAHLAVHSLKRNHLDIILVESGLRPYDSQFHGVGHGLTSSMPPFI